MRFNACELEIELFCRGLRVLSDDLLTDGRGVRRTRAGLGSGLELTIPTGSRLKRGNAVVQAEDAAVAAPPPYFPRAARASTGMMDEWPTRSPNQKS